MVADPHARDHAPAVRVDLLHAGRRPSSRSRPRPRADADSRGSLGHLDRPATSAGSFRVDRDERVVVAVDDPEGVLRSRRSRSGRLRPEFARAPPTRSNSRAMTTPESWSVTQIEFSAMNRAFAPPAHRDRDVVEDIQRRIDAAAACPPVALATQRHRGARDDRAGVISDVDRRPDRPRRRRSRGHAGSRERASTVSSPSTSERHRHGRGDQHQRGHRSRDDPRVRRRRRRRAGAGAPDRTPDGARRDACARPMRSSRPRLHLDDPVAPATRDPEACRVRPRLRADPRPPSAGRPARAPARGSILRTASRSVSVTQTQRVSWASAAGRPPVLTTAGERPGRRGEAAHQPLARDAMPRRRWPGRHHVDGVVTDGVHGVLEEPRALVDGAKRTVLAVEDPDDRAAAVDRAHGSHARDRRQHLIRLRVDAAAGGHPRWQRRPSSRPPDVQSAPRPIGMVASTRRVTLSIFETVPSPKFATQTARGPAATRDGILADRHGGHRAVPVRVDEGHGVVPAVGHPDAIRPDAHADRLVAHRDRPPDDVRLRRVAARRSRRRRRRRSSSCPDHATARADAPPRRRPERRQAAGQSRAPRFVERRLRTGGGRGAPARAPPAAATRPVSPPPGTAASAGRPISPAVAKRSSGSLSIARCGHPGEPAREFRRGSSRGWAGDPRCAPTASAMSSSRGNGTSPVSIS